MALSDDEFLAKLKADILGAPALTVDKLPADCTDPDCTVDHKGLLFMGPDCHPGAGFKGVLAVAEGLVAFFCSVCSEPQVVFKIARGGN